jgi:hypothetical protein
MKKTVRIHYAISDDMEICSERVIPDMADEAYYATNGERNGKRAGTAGGEVRWWLIKAEWDDTTNEVVRWL